MIQQGDIVTLWSEGKRTTGTGIVVAVDARWAHVSWSWAGGKVGRNMLIDLKRVSDNRAKVDEDRV